MSSDTFCESLLASDSAINPGARSCSTTQSASTSDGWPPRARDDVGERLVEELRLLGTHRDEAHAVEPVHGEDGEAVTHLVPVRARFGAPRRIAQQSILLRSRDCAMSDPHAGIAMNTGV